jgi:hypothetical protein
MFADSDSDLSVDQFLDRQYSTERTNRSECLGGARRGGPAEQEFSSARIVQEGRTYGREGPEFDDDSRFVQAAEISPATIKEVVQVLASMDERLAASNDHLAKVPKALQELSASVAAWQEGLSAQRDDDRRDAIRSAATASIKPARVKTWGIVLRVIEMAVVAAIASAATIGWIRLREKDPNVRGATDNDLTAMSDRWAALQRELAAYRDATHRAHTMAEILAAPDVLRFELAGIAAGVRARGLGFVSRTRGVLFTASSLPPPADSSTYQLWLITDDGPVRIGIISPDPAGRVTELRELPRDRVARVTTMLLTLESDPKASSPAGTPFLTSRRP